MGKIPNKSKLVLISKFLGISGFLEFWNPIYKKFPGDTNIELEFCKLRISDKNRIVLIPHMSKKAEKRPIPGNFQTSRKFLEVSRTNEILRF